MAKDPAVLWYTSDFLTGTADMNDEEVGQYTRLLCLQHQRGGYLSHETMERICKLNPIIMEKFTREKDGRYYNERMLIETQNRKRYKENRLENLKGKKTTKKQPKNPHMDSHMEIEIEIENEVNKKGGTGGKPKIQKLLIDAAIEKLDEKNSPLAADQDVGSAIMDFVDYRIRSWPNKPFTEKAAELMATSLIRHSRNRPDVAVKVINRSIEMGWLGLFELPEPELRAIFSSNQATGTNRPPQGDNSNMRLKRVSTIPDNFGVPSPKAITREEYLKQKQKKFGN